jgi:hypothetical protein
MIKATEVRLGHQASRAFGVAIDLPEPVGFTLETDALKEFAY